MLGQTRVAQGASFLTDFQTQAKEFDAVDSMRSYRDLFYLQHDTIYLDGNSLGLMSVRAEQTLHSVIQQWKTHGIDGWQQGEYPWFDLSEKLSEKLATLIGARAHEVIATGSTTINLHQLLATFYRGTPSRRTILADSLTFPSDIYALKSHLQTRGFDPQTDLLLLGSDDGETLNEDDIISHMTEDVCLVVLPSVLYRSGQLLDVERLTREAHARGILTAFDLCHSIGAVPHELSRWGVDFAFWCNYKYLNGGPGAVAGLYVNEKHLGTHPGLAGWFSSDKRVQFDLDVTLTAAADASAYQVGTPHVLSLAPLIGSLNLFEEAGIGAIREKSLKLTQFMMDIIDENLTQYGFRIGTPREAVRRGGHVALVHDEAVRIAKALKEVKVIPDFRSPNIIRLAPISLYTSFTDVYDAMTRLEQVMATKAFEKFPAIRDVIA